MPETALSDWLLRLESLHPEDIELGLERVSVVARRMSLLPVSCNVVTVAGTNGKGSTIAVLEQLLIASGGNVGCYTSPHLLHYNERVRINAVAVTDAQLVESFERVERQRGDIPLTYFEFGTVAALDLFRQAGVDYMLLEVGLGGRLDAVNIVDPDVACITSISLDHESWLGNNREQIAIEKAGILRPGCAFVCADLDPPASLCEAADKLECRSEYITASEARRCGVDSPLRGENIAAAYRCARLLGVAVGTNVAALASEAAPQGRMQRVQHDGIDILLDVAHNQAAVENLAHCVRAKPPPGRCLALFSVLSDKNIHAMIRSCQGVFDAWFVAGLPRVARAAEVTGVAQELRDQGNTMVSENKNPLQAYRRARTLMQPGDLLVVFGSFYTVAEILAVLEKDRSKA